MDSVEALVVLVGVLYKGHWALTEELVLWFVRRASASSWKRECSCLARTQVGQMFNWTLVLGKWGDNRVAPQPP